MIEIHIKTSIMQGFHKVWKSGGWVLTLVPNICGASSKGGAYVFPPPPSDIPAMQNRPVVIIDFAQLSLLEFSFAWCAALCIFMALKRRLYVCKLRWTHFFELSKWWGIHSFFYLEGTAKHSCSKSNEFKIISFQVPNLHNKTYRRVASINACY